MYSIMILIISVGAFSTIEIAYNRHNQNNLLPLLACNKFDHRNLTLQSYSSALQKHPQLANVQC